MRLVYDEQYFETQFSRGDDTTGWVGPLIAAAPGIFGAITSLFGGGRKAQFQGLAEINQAGQMATDAMNQILTALQSGQMSPQQAVSEAQKIVADFNNPQIVYPAKKGNDAAARNNFITQLNGLLQQVQTLAAQVAQQVQAAGGQTVDPVTGQVVSTGTNNTTLLLIGGGILAVVLLMKGD